MNKDWDSDKAEREDRAMRYLAEKAMEADTISEGLFDAVLSVIAVIAIVGAVVLAYWL